MSKMSLRKKASPENLEMSQMSQGLTVNLKKSRNVKNVTNVTRKQSKSRKYSNVANVARTYGKSLKNLKWHKCH